MKRMSYTIGFFPTKKPCDKGFVFVTGKCINSHIFLNVQHVHGFKFKLVVDPMRCA